MASQERVDEWLWLPRWVGVGFVAAAVYAVTEWKLEMLAITSAGAITCFVIQYAMRKGSLGFVYDERGERQKVEIRDRELSVFTPTSHSERRMQEAVAKRERSEMLWLGGLIGFPSAYVTFYIATTSQSRMWMVGAAIPFIFALCFLYIWIHYAVLELLYQMGFQGMKGAKVIDPAPIQPGLIDVAAQKAHADGRVASADEAQALLKTKK